MMKLSQNVLIQLNNILFFVLCVKNGTEIAWNQGPLVIM